MTRIIKYTYITLSFVLSVLSSSSFAQNEMDDKQILSAMRHELQRNMDSIRYNGYEKPFFISYSLYPGEVIRVEAKSGAVLSSVTYPSNNSWARVMVGDYQLNDENYVDRVKRKRHHDGSMPLPLNDDYWAIRRTFWMMTNNIFKNATETYKSKLAAMALKGIEKEALEVADFSEEAVVKYNKYTPFEPINSEAYEMLATEVSAIFKETPWIYYNNVVLFENRVNCFFVNSEGTEVVQPISVFGMMVKAYAYTSNYQSVGSYVSYVGRSISDIPDVEQIKKDVRELTKHIQLKRSLPVYEDSYIGPILFMGQSVPKYLIYKLINRGEGLIAKRNYLVNSSGGGLNLTTSRTWESRLGKRVVDRSINVYSVSSELSYDGNQLIGDCPIDAEGVMPADTLMLIKGGELKNLLLTRTPIKKLTKSTGSKRYGFSQRGNLMSDVVPANLFFESSKTYPTEKLKQRLIDIAIDNGLDYAIIVKSVRGIGANGAVEVYKVSIPEGNETLLRSVSLSKIDRETLWEIEGVSETNEVFNTLLNGASNNKTSTKTADVLSGVPVSIIYPEAVLIERGSIEGRNKQMKGIEPLVPSPL